MRSQGLILLVFAGVVHAQPAALGERLHAALAQRGLGSEALGVIDNLVRHESGPPRAAPALVRELLAQPAAAADAAALFARTVPEALRDFSAQRSSGQAFDAALAAYIERVAEAQALLRGATGPIDEAAVSRELRERGLSAGTLGEMTRDAARVERASALFIAATAQFAAALRGGA